jgi:hypothetical protein
MAVHDLSDATAAWQADGLSVFRQGGVIIVIAATEHVHSAVCRIVAASWQIAFTFVPVV